MLNNHGEVGDFLDVSQFIPGKSAYECVSYCGALVKYSGPPDKGPTGTALQASNLAQYWYGREEGSTDASNRNGMSLSAEYDMLSGMGLHYMEMSTMPQAIREVIAGGKPVLLCGAETGMYDMDLGDIVPYSWTPTGNHCIVVTGIASDGNLLVHDCANIGSSGVRPGPRKYDVGKLQIVSATAVTPPWQGETMLPNGWKDDGHTLTAPNGVPLVLGFRAHVLPLLESGAWAEDDYPTKPQYYMPKLEASNSDLGDGDQIMTRRHMLGYPHNPTGSAAHLKNTVIEEFVGSELEHTRQQYADIYDAYQKLKAQGGQPQPPTQILTDMQQIAAVAAKYAS